MKKRIFTALLIGFTLLSTYAQDSLNIQLFNFIQGNWKGTLTYTDYQDDKKQVTLKTFTSYAIRQDILESSTTYQEPNGMPVYNNSTLKITSKGRIKWGENVYSISQNMNNRLVITCEGMDNDREATIQEIFEFSDNQLSIIKKVLYKGTENYLQRNRYDYVRETDNELEARLWQSVKGIWTIDLRPAPQDAPYIKAFELTSFDNRKLSGVFYGTAFDNGKIHTEFGIIHFSFTTKDQSSTYFHSGYVKNGRIYGSSYSPERDFMMPWQGKK